MYLSLSIACRCFWMMHVRISFLYLRYALLYKYCNNYNHSLVLIHKILYISIPIHLKMSEYVFPREEICFKMTEFLASRVRKSKDKFRIRKETESLSAKYSPSRMVHGKILVLCLMLTPGTDFSLLVFWLADILKNKLPTSHVLLSVSS